MNVNDELLNKLEKLSAIKIADDKRLKIKEQLSEIVGFVEILNELDLDNIQVNKNSAKTIFRQDISLQSQVIDDVLKHSPFNEDHFFIVPKIIE